MYKRQLPQDPSTASPNNPLASQLPSVIPDSNSPASSGLPATDVLGIDTPGLNLGNEFDLETVNDYLGQASSHQHESPFGNQRLVILTTLQTNIDIAKSMSNILKHAEFREVGLSDRALNELRFSYNNCLKKIRKAKQALGGAEKRQRHQRLERQVMHHEHAISNGVAQTADKVHPPVDIPQSLGLESSSFFNSFPPNTTIDIPPHIHNVPGSTDKRQTP